jgi:hypothetical protein
MDNQVAVLTVLAYESQGRVNRVDGRLACLADVCAVQCPLLHALHAAADSVPQGFHLSFTRSQPHGRVDIEIRTAVSEQTAVLQIIRQLNRSSELI